MNDCESQPDYEDDDDFEDDCEPTKRLPDDGSPARRNDHELERLLLALWVARVAACRYVNDDNPATCEFLGHTETGCLCDTLRHDARGWMWAFDAAISTIESCIFNGSDTSEKLYHWLEWLSEADLDQHAVVLPLGAYALANNPREN